MNVAFWGGVLARLSSASRAKKKREKLWREQAADATLQALDALADSEVDWVMDQGFAITPDPARGPFRDRAQGSNMQGLPSLSFERRQKHLQL